MTDISVQFRKNNLAREWLILWSSEFNKLVNCYFVLSLMPFLKLKIENVGL